MVGIGRGGQLEFIVRLNPRVCQVSQIGYIFFQLGELWLN